VGRSSLIPEMVLGCSTNGASCIGVAQDAPPRPSGGDSFSCLPEVNDSRTGLASLRRELALVLHVIGKGAPAAPYECCQPGQGGEKRNKATILPFRWRPRDADHIRWPFRRRTDDAGLRSSRRALFSATWPGRSPTAPTFKPQRARPAVLRRQPDWEPMASLAHGHRHGDQGTRRA
jgi:hypothetical protein